MAIQKVISFYCDESGMFQNLDVNVICPLIVEDKVLKTPEIIRCWHRLGIRWSDFHAVSSTFVNVQGVVRAVKRDLVRGGVYSVYVYHRSAQNYGYDFYFAMLFHLILWESQNILERVGMNLNEDQGQQIKVNLYLARRRQFNPVFFLDFLQKKMTRQVREWLKKNQRSPGNINFSYELFYYPVNEDPSLQISDALSYAIRSFLVGKPLDADLVTYVNSLSHLELKTTDITSKGMIDFCSSIFQSVSKMNIREGEDLLSVIRAALGDGKVIPEEIIKMKIDSIVRQDSQAVSTDMDYLLAHTQEIIRTEKNYPLAEKAIEVLYQINAVLRKGIELSPEILDEFEYRITDLYLTVNNHYGNYIPDEHRMQNALKCSETLREKMSNWPRICSFYSHLAVAYQNVFLFDRAIAELKPRVLFLGEALKNPFTGTGVKGYELGALFGTYAQSLAFSAHCRFFKTNLNHQVLLDLEDAELYSLESMDHFEKEEDRRRQIIYQAHFKMQNYILSGQKTALDQSNKLLTQLFNGQETVETFCRLFPDRSSILPAYEVVTLLKWAYLASQSPGWLHQIIQKIIRQADNIPSLHPIEQLIPYLMLLSPDARDRKEFKRILAQLDFSANIVETIKRVLLAQVEYARVRRLSSETIEGISSSLTPIIRGQWEAYGLDKVLETYQSGPPNRWHVGPMEVLPFNYC